MDARPVGFSRTELGELMLPHQANVLGKVFGGTILAMIDKAAATAAIRHAGKVCVTAQVDRVTFQGPIEIGEVVRVLAEVSYVGRSSLEIEVKVLAMDPKTSAERLTNTSFVTMVAIDDAGKPCQVPRLDLQTDEERARYEAAKQRMQERKARR